MVQLASFLAGENDILSNLNPTDAYTMKDNPDVSIAASQTIGLTFDLFPDSANSDSPFSDLLVRQAMSYAINRQAIADTVLRGFGEVTYQINNPTSWSYNPDIVGYPYDPDKARELLEDAGHGDGFSTVIWYKSEQIYQDLYTAVQADLAAVGIEAELQPLSAGAFDDTYFLTGWIGGVFGGLSYAGPEIGSLATWFWNADSCVPSFAVSTIHPDDLNEACKQLVSATDFESKQSIAREFQSILFDKYCLETIVCSLPFMVAKSSKLHDEYSGMAYDYPYTFADAWMEE
jgi:ABC-type transport system substrate-binding protein